MTPLLLALVLTSSTSTAATYQRAAVGWEVAAEDTLGALDEAQARLAAETACARSRTTTRRTRNCRKAPAKRAQTRACAGWGGSEAARRERGEVMGRRRSEAQLYLLWWWRHDPYGPRRRIGVLMSDVQRVAHGSTLKAALRRGDIEPEGVGVGRGVTLRLSDEAWASAESLRKLRGSGCIVDDAEAPR